FADIAIDAFCRGIFAGDCRKLSVQACFPPLYEMEKKYGSLIAGAVFGFKDPKVEATGLNTKEGEIRLDTKVTSLKRNQNGKIIVSTPSDSIEASLVISAVYSKDLAAALPKSMTDLKEDLSALPSVNVVVGFGHLLPSFESGPILGVVYDSCTYPEHNRKGCPESTCITWFLQVMLRGSWYDKLLSPDGTLPSGSDIVWMASQAAAQQLGIKSHPIRSHVTLQKECLPQYKVGHVSWVEKVEQKIKESNLPLHLVGSSYRGPAINDCIYNAKKVVESLKAH
ncbi:hypothetical protein BgiMline_023426, partial [Biomphalaria glabrata]